MSTGYHDRTEAGRRLSEKLTAYTGRDEVIVLALPRGGVPVGYEVARALRAPLDICVVRKLGVPGYEELAMGAIASGGVRVLNDAVVRQVPNAAAVLEAVAAREGRELKRREIEYRQGRLAPEWQGKTVILVDDGLATGATMHAAVAAVRKRSAAKIVVAVPVGSPETCAEFEAEVDESICAMAPEFFQAVGEFYEDFSQTTDEEVCELLARAAAEAGEKSARPR